MLCWDFVRVGLFFGEHDDGVVGEPEAGGEEVAHALGVVDAALELVAGEAVRDPADHGALPPVRGRGRRAPRRRRGLRAPGGIDDGARRGWRGDVGDGAADGAADAGRAVGQLQRRAAAGAVDEHHHLAGGRRRRQTRVGFGGRIRLGSPLRVGWSRRR